MLHPLLTVWHADYQKYQRSELSNSLVSITSGKVVCFFDIFRFHQQGWQDGNQGQEPRDHKEVLKHGDAGVNQDGLGLFEGRTEGHMGGQAVEALYTPGGQGRQPQRHPHHSRCGDQ